MLGWIILIVFILAVVLLGIYAFRKSNEVRERMMKEFETNEHGELDVYISESNLARPTIPFPSTDELGIRSGTALERVYYHITRNGYLAPKDYKFLNIGRSAGYIYKLRKMGFTIATEKEKDGTFKQYKLICYKLK